MSQDLHFTQSTYQVSVNETSFEGDLPEQGFLTLSCNHSNSSREFVYMLIPEDSPFIIDSMTGELSVTEDLDFESVTQYNFTAVCTVAELNDTEG